MVDLTLLQSLTKKYTHDVPTMIYFHENQLTYPKNEKERSSLHTTVYSFINYKSALVADYVYFNSKFHQKEFIDNLPKMLRQNRDCMELETIELIKEKSEVLYVGVELKYFYNNFESVKNDFVYKEDEKLLILNENDQENKNEKNTKENENKNEKNEKEKKEKKEKEKMKIIWNHRWEYDKNPQEFIKLMEHLKYEKKKEFEIIICGESFFKSENKKIEFEKSIGKKIYPNKKERIKENITHLGYLTKEEYKKHLLQSDIIISTSIHEFFGISVVEGVYTKNLPILPKRLSYIELIPKKFHHKLLYYDFDDLCSKVVYFFENLDEMNEITNELSSLFFKFDWGNLIIEYDSIFENIISLKK
jgi:hypothetical protein